MTVTVTPGGREDGEVVMASLRMHRDILDIALADPDDLLDLSPENARQMRIDVAHLNAEIARRIA